MLHRLLSLLLVVIASSVMVTATVHARELPGVVAIDCSGTVHSDGDADQSQGDADKGVPHHHGACHGSSLDPRASDGITTVVRLAGMRLLPASDRAAESRLVDPGLRPPDA